MFERPSTSRLRVLAAAAAVFLAACGGSSGASSEPESSTRTGQAEVQLETAEEVESAVVESTTTSTTVSAETTPEPPPETAPEPDPTTAPATVPATDPPPATDPQPASTEASQPVSTGVPVGYRPIFDDSGDLRSNVPAEWIDVDGSADGDILQLAAAPDRQGFLDNYTLPGMLLIAGPAVTPEAWSAALAAALDVAEADGCAVSDTSDYSDGVYTGTEHVLSCGSTETTPHLIGGRDAEGDLFFLLAIVRPATDESVRDEIVQSFFID